MLIDDFLPKLEEWVEHSRGRIRADVVHEKLIGLGYCGPSCLILTYSPRANGLTKDQTRRRYAGAGGDEHMLNPGHLVHRSPA